MDLLFLALRGAPTAQLITWLRLHGWAAWQSDTVVD